MKKQFRAQLSVLAGILGFFAGGLINVGKEIVDVMLGAAIGWGIVFFAVYYGLGKLYPDMDDADGRGQAAEKMRKAEKSEKNKGKKIDITVKNEDSFEDIYKLK